MTIKAIFFDIDGTLLSSSGHVLSSTRQAITAARQQGVLVGVATGRDPQKIAELLQDLELDMYITYNGQLVYTREMTIYAKSFEPRTLEAIVQYADENSRSVSFGSRNEVKGSRLMRLGQSVLLQRFGRLVPRNFPVRTMKRTMQKLSFYKKPDHYEKLAILNQPIYQCMMLSPVTEREKLINALPECSFHRSNTYAVDIVPKGGSKFKGICHFLNSKGIKADEAMAFGDHFNDIEMLTGVGVGVAMGNGMAETKEAADYVTDSNNRNGIAKALQHYQIIE